MLNFDRILIIGDSFCAERTLQSDWPVHLGKLLNVEVDGRGFGGQSWWTCKNYLKKFKAVNKKKNSNTILIILHTYSGRLPNDFNLPVTPAMIQTLPNSNNQELADSIQNLASAFYQSRLFSIDFYEWAHQCWIKEIDQDHDFAFKIHVPVFYNIDIEVKNGIVVEPSSSICSLRQLSDAEHDESKWSGPADGRRNHFSTHNNVKLAEAFVNIITKSEANSQGIHYFNNLDQWQFEGKLSNFKNEFYKK